MGQFLTGVVISGFITCAIAGFQNLSLAQSAPPPGLTIPPQAPERIDQTTPRPSEPTPPAQPPSSTPPPTLDLPAPASPIEPTLPSGETFLVKQIDVQGNTVLDREINDLIKPLINQSLTFEDLLTLRAKITQLYIENGYVTSGAFLPNNQDLAQGVVRIQVVEGELERIDIGGLTHLHERYVRRRLERATRPPLNQQQLERTLQLLQIDPLIEQVNAELTAGSGPGRNVLRVNLKEAPAFHIGIGTDNAQPPSIGSWQGNAFVAHDNLLGWGDRILVSYGVTPGLDLYDVSYTLPFNASDGTLSLRYSNNASQIIESDFRDLGIRSASETFSLDLRQPLWRSPTTEFALGFMFDLRRSQTFILDTIPFSFSEGPEQGRSRVSVLRLYQDWLDRNATRVFAARSQFSFGLDAFNATVNTSGTDGRFFAWLGQFQWVQLLTPRIALISRVAAQLTPDSLLSLERFSLGGVDTVRGYPQNQLVGDNGLLASIEARIPLTNDPSVLQLTPFFDFGTAWNNRTADPDPRAIAGLGVGLRWQIGSGLFVRVDYGIPLISVDGLGDTLQENGFYFSLRFQPL